MCRLNSVAWLVCVFVAGFLPQGLGQQVLPPLHPVNVPNFTIPFEFGSAEWAKSIRDVELLVSKDRGRRWYSVASQPVESQKFPFSADSDGEYWFAFRTTTQAGNVSPMPTLPQLRVLVNTMVNTGDAAVLQPSQPSESGPVLPPRPVRYQDVEKQEKGAGSRRQTATESRPAEPPSSESSIVESGIAERSLIGPKLPGFELPETTDDVHEDDMLDALLSGMSPFMDVLPVVVKTDEKRAEPQQNAQSPPAEIPAGGITDIVLNTASAKPRIIVKWNRGYEFWHDAQIDLFRSSTKEEERVPIAINLPNNGEYWWFLSPEDTKPFYITVRIRSLHGGIHTDVTQSPITIDPRLARFSGQP